MPLDIIDWLVPSVSTWRTSFIALMWNKMVYVWLIVLITDHGWAILFHQWTEGVET